MNSHTTNRVARRRCASAFSLPEIMAVLVIIGLLVGVVAVNVRGKLIRGKQTVVKAEIGTICNELEDWYALTGAYPTSDEGLSVLTTPSDATPEPLLSGDLNDPWKRPYLYNRPGREGPYEVYTLGADGLEGGTKADADLGSWELGRGGGSAE